MQDKSPQADSIIEVGLVTKAHGIKGFVKIKPHNAETRLFKLKTELLLQHASEQPHPVVIAEIMGSSRGLLIRFEHCETRSEAEALAGGRLYVPATELEPLAPDEFYYHEIIGFVVVDTKGIEVGTVTSVFSTTIDIMVVQHGSGDIYVPVLEDIVVSIDKPNRRIEVDNIEELL